MSSRSSLNCPSASSAAVLRPISQLRRYAFHDRGVSGGPYPDAVTTSGLRPSLLVRLGLLTGAYSPLFVLLAVLGTFDNRWVRVGFLAAGVLGFLFCLCFLRYVVPHRNGIPERVYRAKPKEGEALKFLASYVIPFFVTLTAAPATRWGLIVYLFVLLVLYLQGDLYFTNPIVGLVGYRLYELTREDGGYLLVLSSRWQITTDMIVRLVPLGGYVYVDINNAAAQAQP